MKAVVLGNGRSGKSAAALLAGEGWDVFVLDGNDSWPEGRFDLCVTSPGIPSDHPWQQTARTAGVRIVSELQLGAERYRSMGGRMLAVTGSKGKSSVVKLVADALDGVPCGNYGKPLCEVVSGYLESLSGCENAGRHPQKIEKNAENPLGNFSCKGGLPVAVVEVSSFQMETTNLPPDTFEAAAVLNLQEDHLDRHGSVGVYHALKLKLLDFAKIKISATIAGTAGTVGTDPSSVVNVQGTDPSSTGRDPGKSEKKPIDTALFAGSYFDNPVLKENGLCAVALMRAAGLEDAAIREAFLRFEALPHRMQKVGVFDGVTYIDDSKATSVSAMIAGIGMAASLNIRNPSAAIRLIAGGLPKGDDPSSAKECLAAHVAGAYLIGRCAESFAAAWKDTVSCEICGNIENAVACAKRDSVPGDTVLLSPGAASFDQFGGYGERGDAFRLSVAGGKRAFRPVPGEDMI